MNLFDDTKFLVFLSPMKQHQFRQKLIPSMCVFLYQRMRTIGSFF